MSVELTTVQTMSSYIASTIRAACKGEVKRAEDSCSKWQVFELHQIVFNTGIRIRGRRRYYGCGQRHYTLQSLSHNLFNSC